MELSIKGATDWLRKNWPAILIGLAIGLLFSLKGCGQEETPIVTTKCDCSMEQKQITELEAKLKAKCQAKGNLHVGAGKPRPSANPDCPDCPACPEFRFDFDLAADSGAGGNAGVTNSGKLSATAAAEVKPIKRGLALSLWVGGDMPVLPTVNAKPAAATVDLQLGPWMAGVGYSPGNNHELRVQARYRLIGK